jgi:mono/diheme cytochrome c family protein
MRLKFAVVAIALVGIVVAGALRQVSAQEKSQWDGIYTAEQAKRGEVVYNDTCVPCHGPDLGGSDLAPALAGNEFAANWNNLKIGDLYNRVSQSMPLSAPGSLTAQQYADVIAFMLEKGSAPAGTTELATTKEPLDSIKYIATKPGQ